ncbi:MAG: hypothetical protein R3C28_02170 [Pirellulaceae bacterium]
MIHPRPIISPLLLIATIAWSVHAFEFQLLDSGADVLSLSGDGSTVFGLDEFTPGILRWRTGEKWQNLGMPERPLFPISTNHEGTFVVGSVNPRVAFWSEEAGFDVLPGDISFVPYAITPDATVFVGRGNWGSDGSIRAYRNDVLDGYLLLDDVPGVTYSNATSVSADGTMIVGTRLFEDGRRESFRWTTISGTETWPLGASFSLFSTKSISADGSVVVWTQSDTPKFDESVAMRWTAESATSEPMFDGWAGYVSADGSVVSGTRSNDEGQTEPIVWTEASGVVAISEILEQHDAVEQGWRFCDDALMSDDGYVIAGDALNAEGRREAWRLVLDRGDFDLNAQFDITDIQVLSDAIRKNIQFSRYDVNNDQRIDLEDQIELVEQLARTYIGDVNGDGTFDTSDLVVVFVAGHYEVDQPDSMTWSQGDWNSDGRFNSSDLVFALQRGGYQQGPRTVRSVPEPDTYPRSMLMIAAMGIIRGGGLRRSQENCPSRCRCGSIRSRYLSLDFVHNDLLDVGCPWRG